MLGFEEPGVDRGIGLAIATTVHTKKPAVFVRDSAGLIRWGIRREGDGGLVPTMAPGPNPPADPELREKLVGESMFAPEHWKTLPPVSVGYPDVDTYRTLQFAIETKPAG